MTLPHPALSDPEMQALVDALTSPGVPSIANAPPEALRALLAAMRPTDVLPLALVKDGQIPRGDGTSLSIRHYVPDGAGPATILYFHGGGWVVGSVDDYDRVTRLLAVRTGCAVISVDYRLAPEHAFPAAVEDAWLAVRTLAVQEKLLIVAGDSAGGNLSTVIARMARDAGTPPIAGQILLYPMVEGGLEPPALSDFVPPILTRDEIAAFVGHYVPDPVLRSDPRFAPATVQDLAGLPPALIVTAGADVLAAQAQRYADRLRQAGGSVVTHTLPDAVHGYFSLAPQSGAAAGTLDLMRSFIADIVRGHGLEG